MAIGSYRAYLQLTGASRHLAPYGHDTHEAHRSDVSNEEWTFLAPYFTEMRYDAPQRHDSLGELFNGLRFLAHMGLQQRFMPNNLPPWQRSTNKLASGLH